MTKDEAAIVTAYTGVLIGEFDDFCKYAEKIIGRSIMTHELASKEMWKELRSAARNDFIGITVQ